MEDVSENSISLTLSRILTDEDMSVCRASLEDASKRMKEDRSSEAISNENIVKGDEILKTYKVVSDAVHGGMGSVWRVHHMGWDIDLAMKRPQPKFFAEGSGHRREEFIAECENWINLGMHPNIVSCYYVRDIGGVPSVFSEWMERGSLKDRILDGSLYEGTGQEVQERILYIGIRAAEGLRYSHANNLIHQDIKPGNILLTKEWDAKVSDFGLSKSEDAAAAKTGGYTKAYCPAEQMQGEEPARWMDIYAWALTVLEMYAQKRLWHSGEEAAEHIDEYLSQCVYKIPEDIQKLIRSCLTEREESISGILSRMISVYEEIFSKTYESGIIDTDMLAAESLNNKAVSMTDLGKPELADRIWSEALSVQPDHAVSVFNQTMYLWAAGKLDSLQAVSRIRSAAESSPSLTREFREEMKSIQSPMQFYHDPMSESADIRTQKRFEIRDADFDTDGSVWLACGTRALYRIDSRTGETTLTQIFSDLEITNVACGSGRYIYFAERSTDCYERFNIFRLDADHDYEKAYVTEIRGHYLKTFLADDENDRLVCTLNSWTRHPFTDEKIWSYSMICVDLETFEQTSLPFSEEQYEGITKAGSQAGCAPGWNILQDGSTLTLSNPELSLRFELKKRIILSVSRDGRLFFTRSASHVADDWGTTYFCYIYQFPENMKLMYRLNQIKDITAIAQTQKITDAAEKEFREAMDRKDHQTAIAVFERFRDQEGNRDSPAVVEMEKELSVCCRKVSVHHLVEMENRNLFSQTRPFDYWEEYRSVLSRRHRPLTKKNRDDFKMLDDQAWNCLLSFVKPFNKLKEQCIVVLIREDNSEFVIMAEPEDRKVKETKNAFSLYLFDPKEESFTCIGVTRGKHNLFSPDGNAWIYKGDSEDISGRGYPVLYQRDSENGAGIGESNIYASMNYSYSFSPDSNFAACCIRYKYSESAKLVFLKAENAEELFTLDLPEEYGSKPSFSADGLSLSLREHLFRISYNYAVPDDSEQADGAEWFIRFWTRKNPSLPEDVSAMDDLMEQLYYCGYGYLKRETVSEIVLQYKKHLEEKNRPKKRFRLFG